jgi:CBS domain-containing protein
MLIADLLRHKGSAVVTIAPGERVTKLLETLAENHIGGVVVLDGASIAGIVSERDIVRHLHNKGPGILNSTVADIMTSVVISSEPTDQVDAVATRMTENRIRHMPVVSAGSLIGIVTIGDVVAARLRSLEQERVQLENYITQG